MCLVSYIPLPQGYIFSSNRDESPDRHAQELRREDIGEEAVFYPKDTAGGSWIMVSSKGRLVCLLNGAFINHTRVLPYRMSRGVMLKLFFKYQNSIDFFEYFDFDGIEPFTMIIVENNRLFEFRWNGLIKHIVELDVERMHVWNSCTLYDQEAQLERAALLKSYLDGVDLMNKEVIKNAHLVKDQENLINGLNMNRGSILTISHTQVVRLSNQINLHYHDLINRTLISQAI